MSKLEEVATTKRGYMIYREPNEAGGYRYWSDAIGGGAVIYDTCITGLDELTEVLRIEYGMGLCALSIPPSGTKDGTWHRLKAVIAALVRAYGVCPHPRQPERRMT